MKEQPSPNPSSFRDPANQVYSFDNHIYRQINQPGYNNYQQLMMSGLYDKLKSLEYIIPHIEVSTDFALNQEACVVLKPEKIAFISYPYEWCFSQIKDAALLTLKIANIAIEYGMMLKDASAYNIQFHHGKPILIDTCSFEIYQKGTPWIAYNQFCKHFLAPLALMAKKDIRLGAITKQYMDGIPLDLASRLLPIKTKFSFSLFAHIHAHAKYQQKFNGSNNNVNIKREISTIGLLGLLSNLRSLVNRLKWNPIKTEWGNYYDNTNYTDTATLHKATIVEQLVGKIKPQNIWDLGANNGYYSRIARACGANIISFDIDPLAVENNYLKIKQEKCRSILPLQQDLTNPSATIGWSQSERDGLQERGAPDLVMAMALIHHLAIVNNLPLNLIAAYFSNLSEYLLIEFTPKHDSQVKRLLSSRKDIFELYHMDGFKSAFSNYYNLLDEIAIKGTERTIFLMQKKQTIINPQP